MVVLTFVLNTLYIKKGFIRLLYCITMSTYLRKQPNADIIQLTFCQFYSTRDLSAIFGDFTSQAPLIKAFFKI